MFVDKSNFCFFQGLFSEIPSIRSKDFSSGTNLHKEV